MKNLEHQYDQDELECSLPHLLSEQREEEEHLFI